MKDGSVNHHTRVRNNESTKQRKCESAKLRNNKCTIQRKCETAKQQKYETTKVRNNETTKQRKSETAKHRKGDAKQRKGDAKQLDCETRSLRKYERVMRNYETTKVRNLERAMRKSEILNSESARWPMSSITQGQIHIAHELLENKMWRVLIVYTFTSATFGSSLIQTELVMKLDKTLLVYVTFCHHIQFGAMVIWALSKHLHS